MTTVISERTHIAKKEHYADGSLWISESLSDLRACVKMTFSEWRAIAQLRANNWKILPGQKYMVQVGMFEGDFYHVKTTPEIHAICSKYDLYPE